MKLGELLIRAGRITPEELEEALNSQVFFGGKLGTNLIEMGCVDENDFVRILSKVTGIPPVQPEQLENIPRDVIALVPADMAEKYRIIPVNVTKRRLHLAMADPTDLPAIDEISFATGLIIIPLIASEPTIARYLHTYYQVSQDEKALRIQGEGRKRRRAEKEPETIAEPAPHGFSDDEGAFTPLELGAAEFDAPVRDPEDNPEQLSQENVGYRESPATVAEVSNERLVRAENREDVASAVMDFVGMHCEKAALLVIKKGVLEGWAAVVAGRKLPGFSDITTPLSGSPAITSVIETKTRYDGPVTDTVGEKRIGECLGGNGSTITVLPLVLQNRVVAILYLTGKTDQTALPEIVKFISKTSMALEILILKNKILMT